MAIGKLTLDIFKQLIPQIKSRPISLVTVGYPDCLVPAKLVGDLFGEDLISRLTYRDDSEKIISWHRAWLNKEDMQAACLMEIEGYTRDMNK